MDSKTPMMNDSSGINWDDPMFNSTPFDESMAAEFNDFTNLYADSPGMLKPSRDTGTSGSGGAVAHSTVHFTHSASTEGSSQDSGSDSSSRRKRKVTSESPMSDAATEQPSVKKEDSSMDLVGTQGMQQFDQNFTQPMHELSLEHDDPMRAHFGFDSSSSSPVRPRKFNSALSLNAQVNLTASSMATQYQQSPVSVREAPVYRKNTAIFGRADQVQIQTINPGMFQIGSREESPIANNMMFSNASPTAIFSTPSSDSNDTFNTNAAWNNGLGQNPTWPNTFNNQFGATEGFGMTPSPVVNGATPALTARALASRALGRSPLHIAPISTKSRVETQINIVMTLEKPPTGIEYLHLPLHTIAKSKLLAKEQYDTAKALELHAMLVCTSAMNNPQLKEKALQRAAVQDNTEIQRRAERLRAVSDEEKNSLSDVDDSDKPSNGGEVRICSNCIQRERKRAGRKKLKKEEEQQHWERFETERVVVFNSNEYLPWKPHDTGQTSTRESTTSNLDDSNYVPPEGALHVSAAMRIACYCRHQSEKEGFRVIFTLKDQHGTVIAQQMSDSILITDDHKTHPPSYSTAMSGEMFYQNPTYNGNSLPTSYSMVDLSSQVHPFPSSRSTGNLQAMAYGQQQYNTHSHIHQMPGAGYTSQNTSATMTPTSLSRPGSPSSAGQAGPNKKRKSSSFHRRVPSGLTMTPRVETNQHSTSNASSAASMTASSFSPTSTGAYTASNDQPYMTIPNSAGAAQYFGSGPPTPAHENTQFFNQSQMELSRGQNTPAYFSHPSSAVPSRANSPVLQSSRPNMATYSRQPIQTPTNSIQGRQPIYAGQSTPGLSGHDQENTAPPTITKITPAEGPVSGGTEVSIYGYNFTNGTQVMFGEQLATTVFYGPQALLATSPPSRPGGVSVTLVPPGGTNVQHATPVTGRQVFTYTDTNPRMMEMALRFLSQQQTGSQMPWNQFTNQVATKFLQSGMSAGGMRGSGYEASGMVAFDSLDAEDMMLRIVEQFDHDDSFSPLCLDMAAEHGETLLSLACASGMHRFAAALLARGASPDVRDVGGYTPLMHAALQAQIKTFQLLIVQGADPALRSLKGYSAIELVPGNLREDFAYALMNTSRSRYASPTLKTNHSFVSVTSSGTSWDISSASFYESDSDTISQAESRSSPALPQRTSSLPVRTSQQVVAADRKPSLSTMLPWRNGLATQIRHLHQIVRGHLPQFQLPHLPGFPDCQSTDVVRRISALIPGRIATPARMLCSGPPPAYHELYPNASHPNAMANANSEKLMIKNAERRSGNDVSPTKPGIKAKFNLVILHLDARGIANCGIKLLRHQLKARHPERAFAWLLAPIILALVPTLVSSVISVGPRVMVAATLRT